MLEINGITFFNLNLTTFSLSIYYQPNVSFYCTTIAYHVELNAISGGRRHLVNVQKKNRHPVLTESPCPESVP